MQIFQGYQDLGGEEPDCLKRKAVGGLFAEEGVEVPAGAVVNEETGVVRNVDVGVECREERVVEHGEDVGLHLDVGELFTAE